MNKTEALARQQALVNQARAESRSLTPEEQAEFERCQQIIDAAPADSASQGAPEGQRGADPAAPDPIQQALANERQRTADITSLCRQVGMDAAPSIDTMQAIMLKLLRQTDPFGESIMVQPRFVIVPVGYGFKMAQILESPQIDVEGIGSHTANALYQYRNRLQVVEEGTINTLAKGEALPWFMAGDPATGRSIQVDYLNGMKTPSIRRSQPAGRLGYVWDIWMDWGVSAVDWRGIAKNPGVNQ